MSLGGSRDSEPPYLNTPRKIRPRENVNHKDPTGPSPNSRKLGRSLSRIAPSTLDRWLDHTERLDKFYKELIQQMEYKLEETTMPTHSTFAPVCSSPPQLVSFGGTCPPTTVATSLRVSAHKTRNPPERFRPYPTRSKASPTHSAMEPDIIPAPPGLKMSPSNITHELTPARKLATKFTSEMVLLPISQPLLSLGTHISKTEGMSSQIPSPKCYTSSIVNSSRVVNNWNEFSETHLRVSNKFPKTHTPNYSGEHEYSSPYNISLSSRITSRDATRSNVIPAPRVKQEVYRTSNSSAEEPDMHTVAQTSKTPPELEGSASGTLPEMPMERVNERSISIFGLADVQVQTSSFSAELGEERRVYNSVVSIHVKDEEQHSSETVSTAFALPGYIPISSPIPITRATSKSCPSTPSHKHGSQRVQREVRRTRDSTSESRNAPERVQMTRSQTRPSSLKPDSVSVPRELQRNTRSSLTDNELSKARKVDSHRKPPSESIMETASAVSHASSMLDSISVPRELHRNPRSSLNKDSEPSKAHNADSRRETATAVSHTSSKLATHVKKRQSSESCMLVQKRLNKSTGTVDSSTKSRAVVDATSCAPSSGAASNSKSRTGNAIVSRKKQASDSRHAPSTKTAPTLSKSSPVSSLRARPSNRLTNEPKPSLSNVSKRRTPNVVNTKQMVKTETHQRIDAHSRASLPNANPRFGKIPSSPNTGESEEPKRAVNLLGSPSGLPKKIPECSEEHSILFGQLASAQVNSLSTSDEMGEKRRTLDTVISIQKENNKNNLPEATAALTLPAPALDTSPIHPGPLRHSLLEGIRPQVIEKAIQKVSTPETRNMLERVQMTRSEASPSSMESDNHPEPPGLNTSPPNVTHEPTSARNPTSVKYVPEMVLPISRPSLNLSIKSSSSGRTVLTPFPKRRDVKKQSIGKAKISLTKGTTNAAKCLPASKTASSLAKPSTVVTSSTRASPTRPSKDRIAPPFPVVPKRP